MMNTDDKATTEDPDQGSGVSQTLIVIFANLVAFATIWFFVYVVPAAF